MSMCVYIYMYVCLYVCTYVYTHMDTHVCINLYFCLYMYQTAWAERIGKRLGPVIDLKQFCKHRRQTLQLITDCSDVRNRKPI